MARGGWWDLINDELHFNVGEQHGVIDFRTLSCAMNVARRDNKRTFSGSISSVMDAHANIRDELEHLHGEVTERSVRSDLAKRMVDVDPHWIRAMQNVERLRVIMDVTTKAAYGDLASHQPAIRICEDNYQSALDRAQSIRDAKIAEVINGGMAVTSSDLGNATLARSQRLMSSFKCKMIQWFEKQEISGLRGSDMESYNYYRMCSDAGYI